MFEQRERSARLQLVDHLLLEQGAFAPLDYLLATERLDFADYEAWRLGQHPDLLSLLQYSATAATPAESAAELADHLQELLDYARAQGLAACQQPLESWGDSRQPLRVGGGPLETRFTRILSTRLEPDAARTQLDLFHDSSASLLETRIREALCARRPAEAAEAMRQLRERQPHNRQLADWQRLVDAPRALTELADADTHWSALADIASLARQHLGSQARDYLSPLWARLAATLTEQSAHPDRRAIESGRHAAAAWAKAERWRETRDTLEAQADWRAHAALIDLHAHACWHQRDSQGARHDWLELCWEHPVDFTRRIVSPEFPDRALIKAWNRFEDLDAELDTEDFPAWLQLSAPGLAPDTLAASPLLTRGEVLAIARQLCADPDRIALREMLDAEHPELLRAFLRGREPGNSG